MSGSRLESLLNQVRGNTTLVVDPINRYYLTGFHSTAGYLVASRDGIRFLVDGRYYAKACEHFSGTEIEIARIQNYNSMLKILSQHLKGRDIFAETHILSYDMLRSIVKATGVRKVYPLKTFIQGLRACKDSDELETMRESSRLTGIVYRRVLKQIRKGITERGLKFALLREMLELGCEPSFDPIVAFGQNSALPHHQSGNCRLKPEMPVLLDFGLKYGHYCSDVTRTFWYGRRPSDFFRETFELVKKVKGECEKRLRGKTFLEIHQRACRMFGDMSSYFVHSLGHSIGLEIHEEPSLTMPEKISRGNVFTIEPGLYFPGQFGVRIEDTCWFNGSQLELLTEKIPIKLRILPASTSPER